MTDCIASIRIPVSTIFVSNTVAEQNSANTVYNFKTIYDARVSTLGYPPGLNRVYNFKSDAERMQNLLGRMAAESPLSSRPNRNK